MVTDWSGWSGKSEWLGWLGLSWWSGGHGDPGGQGAQGGPCGPGGQGGVDMGKWFLTYYLAYYAYSRYWPILPNVLRFLGAFFSSGGIN